MRRFAIALLVSALFAFVNVAAYATTTTFTASNFSSLNGKYSINDGSDFYVSNSALVTTNAKSTQSRNNFYVYANSTVYGDAGIVLGFDNPWRLGDITGVNVSKNALASPVAINIWLDTSGDGNFFSFDSAGKYLGSNGDAYYGDEDSILDRTSSLQTLNGVTASTFSDLMDIYGPETPVAFWIGLDSTDGTGHSAYISSVTVAATPEPSTLFLLGLGLAGVVAARFRMKRA